MDRSSESQQDGNRPLQGAAIERARVSPRMSRILLVSGVVNLALVAYVCYDTIRDRDTAPVVHTHALADDEEVPVVALLESKTNSEVVSDFRYMTLEQLIEKLSDTALVEDGYSQRDLALACLVAFHQFDLPKALLGQPQPTQQRQIVVGGQDGVPSAAIIVYPELSEDQFGAIVHFAGTERWPLTSLGLYRRLQAGIDPEDPTLNEAFYLTQEFLAIEMLFNRGTVPVEKAALLELALSGEWSTLSRFCRMQRRKQDFSPAQRQALLLDYLTNGAPVAAELLLSTEEAFAHKKLDDMTVVRIMELLPVSTSTATEFAVDMLVSPRSDMVWQVAAEILYKHAGESFPEGVEHLAVVQRFAPNHAEAMTALSSGNSNKAQAHVDVVAEEVIHTVKRGDSLWKISREYKVKIDEIKQINDLHSDFLKPGRRLVIRRGEG